METQTDWVSAVAILASGLILGLMVIVYLSRRKSARSSSVEVPDAELLDLEAKRDLLITQLREIDDVAVTPTPEQMAEKRRLETAAAEVLRQIDGHKSSVQATRAAAPAPAVEEVPAAPLTPGAAAMRGFIFGALSAAILVGLGYFVYKSATDRGAGDGPTGSAMAPNEVGRQPAANDPQILALEASVAQNPGDVNQRIELARAYLEHDELMKVFEHTNIILKDAPDEPRALTYNALVRLAMGQQAEAVEMLQKANTVAPDLIDASVALAWAYTQQSKKKEAEATMLAAMQQHPDEKVRLEEVLNDMRKYTPKPVTRSAGPVDPNAPLPPGHPPVDGSAPAAGAPMGGNASGSMSSTALSGDPRAVKVTLDIDPASKAKMQAGGRLFVIARAAGVMAGPPSAVKALTGVTFPLSFDLSSADSMMGQPLPEKLRLEARLDSDGDAKTKGPNDLTAVQDGVAAGSTISLKLK